MKARESESDEAFQIWILGQYYLLTWVLEAAPEKEAGAFDQRGIDVGGLTLDPALFIGY